MNDVANLLFSPARIGSLTLKNRYVMAPMASFGLVDTGGVLTDDGVEYFVTRARGGFGLIITGTCFVDDTVEEILPHTLMCTERTDLWHAKQQLNRLAERAHAYGSRVFIQLASGYGRSARIPSSAGCAVAPSEIPNRWDPSILHREITVEEIHRIVAGFGRAAAFCKGCGIDGVEVHAVHEGYLLDQFTVPFFNRRTDEYGGSFENRYRFAVEIVQEIKAACGADFPTALRFTAKHYLKGLLDGAVDGEAFEEKGRDLPEALGAAKYLESAGYDALDVDLGCYDAHFWNHPSVYQKDGLYLDAAAQVKQAVTIPVIVAGRMDSPRLASDAVRSGKCDFIALGRPSLADPDLPNKLAAGQTSQIRPCISCNYGCCTKVHQTSGRAGCSVNPQCANELHTRLLPAVEPKRIAVIGGGPGGCECARVLALRGHTVTLFERQPRLGGALIPASRAGFKHHDAALIAYYENELSRLGVDVRTGTAADADCVAALSPDVVVVATGARPNIPQIPGIDRALTAEDALTDPSAAGQSAVIFGTGLVGVETALWMLELGKAVTLIGRSDRFMPKALYSDAEHARALLRFQGATLMSETAVEEIGDGWVRVRRKGSAPEHLDADTFICAAGYRGDDTVYQVMRTHFPIVYNIGDSAAARNIYAAVHEAYELASNL